MGTAVELRELARNLWWTWQPRARELWQRVSPPHWARSPNPLSVLQTMELADWEVLDLNDSFVQLYEEVIAAFDRYMGDDETWYQTHQEVLYSRMDGAITLTTDYEL